MGGAWAGLCLVCLGAPSLEVGSGPWLVPSGSLWVSRSPWVIPVTLPSLPQRLKDYQKRLDLSHLRQSSDPMLSEFKVALPALASPLLPDLPLPLLPPGLCANAPRE